MEPLNKSKVLKLKVKKFVRKLSLIAIICVILFSFKGKENKKIIGHWVSEIDLYDMKVNDTLIFTKIKYNDRLYQWGGALAGIELGSDSSFSEYHTVLCSSESSPVRFGDEKWTLSNNTIFINSSEREMDWKIISANNKKLMIVVSKINFK